MAMMRGGGMAKKKRVKKAAGGMMKKKRVKKSVGELKGLRTAKDLLQESTKYIENDDNEI